MVPATTNPKWKELVLGKKTYEFSSLATKIMMGRVQLSIKNDPAPGNVERCIREVQDYFIKNEKVAQNDLNKIFEGGK